MNILIFGLGMYVIGSDDNSYGTIFPALLEFQKKNKKINKVIFYKKTKKNINKIKNKINYQFNKHNTFFKFEIRCDEDSKIKKFISNTKEHTISIICLPDHLHFHYASLCIKKNLHCLVVKPLTYNLSEAKKLSNLSEKNNLYTSVEFHKRLDKQNLILRDNFNKTKFGLPLYSIVEFSQRKIIPSKNFNKWSSKTNILNYLGVHYIDLMRFISGATPNRVMAIGQNCWLKNNQINNYDSIQCLIEWRIKKHKFIQNINVNWIDPNNTSAMSDQKIKVIFSNGRIECDQKNRGIEIVTDQKGIEHINPDFCVEYGNSEINYFWDGYGINSVLVFLEDTLKLYSNKITVKKLNKIRPTFKEAIYSSAILDYANKSLKSSNNSWLKIKI